MIWTSEPPQAPGWYWLRINGDEADIVRINKRTVHGKTYLTISAVGENCTIPLRNKRRITMAKYDWKSIDWHKSTLTISKELGCAITQVSRARRMYAPETSNKRSHPKTSKYAWDAVDWNKSTRQISNELGCNYQYARQMRHKLGVPKRSAGDTMISIRVTDALYSELQKRASERGYKLSTYMREILTQFMESNYV